MLTNSFKEKKIIIDMAKIIIKLMNYFFTSNVKFFLPHNIYFGHDYNLNFHALRLPLGRTLDLGSWVNQDKGGDITINTLKINWNNNTVQIIKHKKT